MARTTSLRVLYSLLAIVLLGAVSSRAHAFCSVYFDPPGVRIRAEPLAFVGVVERVENGIAHITVQKRIRGAPASKVLVWDFWAGYTGACQDVMMEEDRLFSVGDQVAVFASPRGDDASSMILREPRFEGGALPLYIGGLNGGYVFFFVHEGVRAHRKSDGALFDADKFREFSDGRVPLSNAVIDPRYLEAASDFDDPEFKPELREELREDASEAEAMTSPAPAHKEGPVHEEGPPSLESHQRGCSIGTSTPMSACLLFLVFAMRRRSRLL